MSASEIEQVGSGELRFAVFVVVLVATAWAVHALWARREPACRALAALLRRAADRLEGERLDLHR
ncbi:MAG: hypothetical protein E6640_01970 [Actinomyces urogenitalis]|uniref:hypothetical protein n=1 Tax=Actinomyces urogenitalis TaxID=103621 RepID=UPI00290E7F99|nr:hypothetical protein [Actinomyces urogenitalis]MDU6150979.1 hypothetical protein [Actinomyces urogenitalis]